ncbi:MAG: zinc-finger domain-containing protein [Bacillus sp. (in: firmicutes)]
MSKKEKRMMLLDEVDRTLREYCEGCFVYSTHRKELGRTYAHKFCLSHCTVGQQLREAGNKINNIER